MNSSSLPHNRSCAARLTLEEVAGLLQMSAIEVRERTKRGQLIAFKAGSSAQKTVYPAFQFLPELRELVGAILGLLGPLEAYAFLAAVHPDMERLSPLEVLLGSPLDCRPLTLESQRLLDMSLVERNRFVLGWCRTRQQNLGS